MLVMTIVSQEVGMDGHIQVRVRFEEKGVITTTKDFQFYQVTQEQMLEKLKEQCRQLALSLDTAEKNKSLVGLSWTYDLATEKMTEGITEKSVEK